MHREARAGPQCALDGEPAAMAIEHVLDQREAQARAALRAADRDVDAVEALGQTRQMLGRDTGAEIAHGDARFRRTGAGLAARTRDIAALSRGAVFQRVLDQILELANAF